MSEIELKSLIKKREYEFKCMQIIYDLSLSVSQNISKLSSFKARYKSIEKIRNNYVELCEEIDKLQLNLNPKYSIDNQVLLSFDELYFAAIEFADSLENSVPAQLEPCLSHSSITPVKLLKLQIPKFDGCIENWQTFKDSYEPLVHNNVSLPDIEKFYYLLSCLSGSALSLAKGVPITSSNYNVVFSALLERYDNKRILATTYLEKIFQLSMIQKPTLENLSNLTNILFESVNALRALNIKDLGEFILFFIASRPLDLETRRRFELQNKNEIPTFDNFVSYLQNYIKVLEVSQPALPAPSNLSSGLTNKQIRTNKVNNNYRNQRPSFTTSSKLNNINNQVICVCCNEKHSIYRCAKMHSMTIDQRQNLVKKLCLCINCLRPGHDNKICKSKSTCFICNAKHNTLLHVENKKISITENSNLSASSDSSTALTCMTKTPSASTKILGTAVVRLRLADGSLQHARALIDSGSMDSFIIVRELLNPPSNGMPVRLEIFIVMSHSMLSTVTITWHASALHVINPYIFESVEKIKKKNLLL